MTLLTIREYSFIVTTLLSIVTEWEAVWSTFHFTIFKHGKTHDQKKPSLDLSPLL